LRPKTEAQQFEDWIELRAHGGFEQGAGDGGAIRLLSPNSGTEGRLALRCALGPDGAIRRYFTRPNFNWVLSKLLL